MNCEICLDQITFDKKHVNCENNHFLHDDCFQRQVQNQIEPQNRGHFKSLKCKIVCSICKIPFSNKQVAQFVDDETFDKFNEACGDVIAKNAIDEHIESNEKKKTEDSLKSYDDLEITRHVVHICEKYFNVALSKSKM